MRAAAQTWTNALVATEFRRAILWLPVGLGLGIWLYLSAAAEPPAWAAALPALPAMLLLAPRLGRHLLWRPLLIGAFAVSAGHALAQSAAWRADQPRLVAPITASLEGRVVARDRAASGAPRVTLERLTVFGLPRTRAPERVRVTLLATAHDRAPDPGDWIHVYATLLPPGAPVEPGGFDFARRAYFDRLGAVGFARTPAVRVAYAETAGARAEAPVGGLARLDARLQRLRLSLSEAIRTRLPGPDGAFAAAIMVGDRAGIDEADAEALRISSLAHLLAISGLHMGLLTGLVFAGLRLGLALVPPLRAALSAKKTAAFAALAAGAAYLALSGGTVATQRAFVMAAVALVAVMLDRPAITLRGLALAATVVLAIRPISLVDPGFQMSFAATTALVAAYEALRGRRPDDRAAPATQADAAGRTETRGPVARTLGPVAAWTGRRLRALGVGLSAVLFTSLVAGLATAPVAAMHFHRMSPYALLANIAAVPVMGTLVAPASVAAGFLAPFGLAGPALDLAGAGIGWIRTVAHWVAAMPGADARVAGAPGWLLGTLALAGLWLALWRGWWRLAGAAGLLLALALAEAPARPDLLIAPGARLVGVLGPEGRVLSRAVGQGYAAERWLAADGDGSTQGEAARRPGLAPSPDASGRRRGVLHAHLGTGEAARAVAILPGRLATPERLSRACRPGAIVVAPNAEAAPEGDCLFLGQADFAGGATLGVTLERGRVRVRTSAPAGGRPWHASGR